jgi:acetyl-CoA carboxylase carboxyl transferase subunit beta
LLKLGLVDGVIPESPDGLALDVDFAGSQIRHTIVRALDDLSKKKPSKLVEERSRRYRSVGDRYVKTSPPRRDSRAPARSEEPEVAKSA